MVAVIKTGHSIHRILNYNENKVKEGVAECIWAVNYLFDPDKMSFTMKLDRFRRNLEMNENVKRNSVHISLNFDVSETRLSKEDLIEIAEVYMEKIGFGDQPYLVYQHFDAGHPHIHIVTVNVESTGKRIDLFHLGILKSEPARKSIEKEFGLVVAEAQKKQEYRLKPVSARRVLYGKSPTKQAIQNVLDVVVNQYKYTNLPELNAVLKQYNIVADRGTKDSRVYQSGGLLYKVLDACGNPVGVPIKASLFYNKPTLKFLENRFKENEAKRLPYQSRIRNAVDLAFWGGNKVTLETLVKELEKEGIHCSLHTNQTGLIYGITYVDYQTKCVFNGSDLGKKYSAKGIQERCAIEPDTHPDQKQTTEMLTQSKPQVTAVTHHENASQIAPASNETQNILDGLMKPEPPDDYLPYQLRRKKKRKRKYLSNH